MSVIDLDLPRTGIRNGVRVLCGKAAPALALCLTLATIAQARATAIAATESAEIAVAIPRKQDMASFPRGASFNERFGAVEIAPLQVAVIMPDAAVSAEPETTGSLPTPAVEPAPQPRPLVAASEAMTGTASMYDPGDKGDRDAGNAETSSGENYDANGWTAAIQIDLRDRFGGVRFGRNYQPAYALVEAGGKQLIVKINDVGPLKPGRIIDLNVRAMRYFDPSMQASLIAEVKVTPLAGEEFALGPVTGPMPVTVASRDLDVTEAP